jgi:hypothetical protein
MPSEHYDGDSPDEPLPPEHFTKEEREEAANLGDGSPALDPRGGRNVEQKAEADAAAEKTEDVS